MTRYPVKSSNIRAVGYEAGTLEIEFTNGSVHAYSGVPQEVYSAMVGAESVGKYFSANVRGKFESVKVSQ